MEHKSVKSDRGTTHYWIKRNSNEKARCIVFTHGLTANHMMFEKQVEYLSDEYTKNCNFKCRPFYGNSK